MAQISGNRRTVVYLFDETSKVNELALQETPIISNLYATVSNYIVNEIKYSYITFAPAGSGPARLAIMYELFLMPAGDALFTSTNVATLQSQLGVSSLPTWTESILWGA